MLVVVFRKAAEGTEVQVVHSGWEARGEEAREIRDRYQQGWGRVLELLARQALEEMH